MADGDVVATKEVTVFVHVRQWNGERGTKYDWVASNGLESDTYFDDAVEAMHDGLSGLRD